jgi:hypothetical protein
MSLVRGQTGLRRYVASALAALLTVCIGVAALVLHFRHQGDVPERIVAVLAGAYLVAVLSNSAAVGLDVSTDGGCSASTMGGAGVGRNISAVFAAAGTVRVLAAVSRAGSGPGTITSGDSLINCGTACIYTYNRGASVVLTARPSGSSTFAGWSGDDHLQAYKAFRISCTPIVPRSRVFRG